MPPPEIRRVVTGHDAQGRAVVKIDEVARGEPALPPEQTATSILTMIWTTDKAPASNTDDLDGARRETRTPLPGGTLFRIGQLEPGQRSPMHRTVSTDYGLVLEGELDMELDGGEVVHLKAGDVVVQRGTNHSWINRGAVPCKMAWILIDAEPVRIGEKVLEAMRPGSQPPSSGSWRRS